MRILFDFFGPCREQINLRNDEKAQNVERLGDRGTHMERELVNGSCIAERDGIMSELLSKINGPADLRGLSDQELHTLAQEMRDELVRVLSIRPAHFASNLGVVELCLALHLEFDFTKDRLIWDTGHQIYPHKLITGRYPQFDTIRTRGGLMGYPNPQESQYDLFMTGHAGCAASCAAGPEDRRRAAGPGATGTAWPWSATAPCRAASSSRRSTTPGIWAASCSSFSTTIRCRSARASAPWPSASTGPGLTNFYQASKPQPAKADRQDPAGRRAWPPRPSTRFATPSRPCSPAACSSRNSASTTSAPIDGHDLAGAAPLAQAGQGSARPGAAARADRQGQGRAAGQRRPGDLSHAAGVRKGGAGTQHRRRSNEAAREATPTPPAAPSTRP